MSLFKCMMAGNFCPTIFLLAAAALLTIFPSTLAAQEEVNTHFEHANDEIRLLQSRVQDKLGVRTPETDAIFDRAATEIARAQYRTSKEFEVRAATIRRLQSQLESHKSEVRTTNSVDAFFYALMDDAETQAQLLEMAMGAAESNEFEAARIIALTTLSMNGDAARIYTTRLGSLTGPDHPFHVRLFAIYAIGEINPAVPSSRELLGAFLGTQNQNLTENRTLARAAIAAIGKGREKNAELAPLILKYSTSTNNSSIINAAAAALAEISAIPDESIAQIYKSSIHLDSKSAAMESIAKLARLARNCETLSVLRNAEANFSQLSDFQDYRSSYTDGITNLDSMCLEDKDFLSKSLIFAWRWFLTLNLTQKIATLWSVVYAICLTYLLIYFLIKPHRIAEKAFRSLARTNKEDTQGAIFRDLANSLLNDPASLAFKVLIPYSLIIRWLGSTEFATRKWAEKYREQLAECAFLGRSSVARRSSYHDIAGIASHMQESNKRQTIWIHGPGGAGKSTLAFKMAKLITSQSPGVSIPVVIDDEWEDDLLKFVACNFRPTHEHPQVPEAILKNFIHSGIIVLVFDGISEKRSSQQNQLQYIKKLLIDIDPRKIIFTSRSSEAPAESHSIALGPVEGDQLDILAEGLVSNDQKSTFLSSLNILRGTRPIAPLFVELAAQRFNAGHTIPDSYPELVTACVEAINPGPDVPPGDFLELARVAAYICIDDECHTPRSTNRHDYSLQFTTLLNSENMSLECNVTAADSLQLLTEAGLLRQETTLAQIRWSFLNDPFCEYLAALYIFRANTWYREDSCQNAALVKAVNETRSAAEKMGI